jgi:hypothetical protein
MSTIAAEQPRFFTVEEANRTLPLVRRIVKDIVSTYPELQHQTEQMHHLASAGIGPELQTRIEGLRDQIDVTSDRINGFVRELERIGCYFKGFDEGLVDFYSLYKGKPVFLCWKFDEKRITHWHDVESGFGGRQPITTEFADEIRRALPS